MKVLSLLAASLLSIGMLVSWLHLPVASQEGPIDYKTLTTNHEKLAACESLIGQTIREYNRQSVLAVESVSGLSQEFREYSWAYTTPVMSSLLTERARLQDLIRDGQYDAATWQVLLAGAGHNIADLYADLYGNKTTQRIEDTAATSAKLLELKQVRLYELDFRGLVDPTEDFTTYTEVDPNSHITVDANTLDFSGLSRAENAWVYYDKGVDHFTGTFTHREINYMTSGSGTGACAGTWQLSNTVDDFNGLVAGSDDALAVALWRSGTDPMLQLNELNAGSQTADASIALAYSTVYYVTVDRTAEGTYGKLYLYICTTNYYGESGSNLIDTLLVTLTEDEDFQYMMALNSWGGGSQTCVGYVEDLDLQEVAAPLVDTDPADDLEDTTATLNGEVTNINDTSIDTRGFVWDTSTHGNPGSGTAPADSDYASYWTEAGSFGTGVFDHGVTSLATATLHYFRAAAENDNSLWGYGDEATFLTKPAAPTNVAATDGVHTDKVVVAWTKSSGTITGYKIYRDAGLIDTVGDVATYDDTGADAPTITPGGAVCSDGTYTDKVNVAVSGDSANVGTTHTYKVRAYNDTGDSDDSATDTGYRGVGSLTYQWWRSSTCADSGYSPLGGATTDPYDDMTAPAPTISGNNATACDGCSSAFVTLSCNETVANGACRYYHAVLSATGAASANSTSDSGYRGTTTLTYQWWRSAADTDAAYSVISGGTTDPYNDTGGVVDPDGRYYLTTVSMSGAVSVNSSADRGYMSTGNITTIYVYPEWQSRFLGLNASLWAVGWAGDELAINQTVVWNTTGVGEILWAENVTGSDGRADCIITSNGTGNQTVGCSGGSGYDQGICLWVDESPADLPTWYFVILGVALVGAWFTKEILLYIMSLVACGGMVWWAQNSTLEQETILILTAVFVILGGVMVFGMLRKGQFSFIQGGDLES